MNFFDTKNFSMRREVVKRFLETGPSKQTTSVEKKTFYDVFREMVTRGHVEHVSQNHWNQVHQFLLWTYVELQFLIYNYFLVVIFTPTQQSIAKEHPYTPVISTVFFFTYSTQNSLKTQLYQWITRENTLNDAFVEKSKKIAIKK